MSKDLYFKRAEDFTGYIVNKLEYDEPFIAVVGKFNSIKLLLKEVMTYDLVDFESLEIESEFMGGYADEFVLSLWMDDDVVKVGCEKLKRDGEYISPCGDETYLMEDCSSKVIPLCEESDVYYVSFDEECDCCEECDECCSCNGCCADRDVAGAEEVSYYIIRKPTFKAGLIDDLYNPFIYWM